LADQYKQKRLRLGSIVAITIQKLIAPYLFIFIFGGIIGIIIFIIRIAPEVIWNMPYVFV